MATLTTGTMFSIFDLDSEIIVFSIERMNLEDVRSSMGTSRQGAVVRLYGTTENLRVEKKRKVVEFWDCNGSRRGCKHIRALCYPFSDVIY